MIVAVQRSVQTVAAMLSRVNWLQGPNAPLEPAVTVSASLGRTARRVEARLASVMWRSTALEVTTNARRMTTGSMGWPVTPTRDIATMGRVQVTNNNV